MKKNSPNYGLAKEQFYEIDKHFYENYNIEYFGTRLLDIVQKLSNPQEYIKFLSNKKLTFDKVSIQNIEDSKIEDIVLSAKLELITTHYHCLESFMRLFIALNNNEGCVNLALAELESRDFRRIVKNLAKGDYSNFKDTSNNIILNAFIGNNPQPKLLDDSYIENWKDWIQQIARSLLDSNANNVYKHGFCLQVSKSSIAIGIENKDIAIKNNGDTVINYTISKERNIWIKKTRFVNYSLMIAEIDIISKMIGSMIEIRKIKTKELPLYYPSPETTYQKIVELAENSKDNPFQLKSMEIDLLYYNK